VQLPIYEQAGDEHLILVYHLGGHTSDVTVLSVDEGVFEVLAAERDTMVHGNSFDRRTLEFLASRFSKENNVDFIAQQNATAIHRLERAVEQAKHGLSSELVTCIELENFHNGIALSESLTRAMFEDLNEDLFRRSLRTVDKALRNAKVKKAEIEHAILVGGSTRIPFVQDMLRDYFDSKTALLMDIEPDQAVAKGAALQGKVLADDSEISCLLEIPDWPAGWEVRAETPLLATDEAGSDETPHNWQLVRKGDQVEAVMLSDEDLASMSLPGL
jgi:endoplasmic reticulum chaperone BiP